MIVEMSSSVLQQGNLSYTFHFFLKSTFVKYKNLAGRVVPLPQEGKTCSLAGFHNLQLSNMNKSVQRLRSPCAIGEDLVGPDEVKADRVEEEEKEENITAEKVMEEKKYVKSTRLCQFFNIC